MVSFKDTTGEGDIVLVVADQVFYALVCSIERDTTRKDEWWHVTMQMLTLPPRRITWTLREPQLCGQESFTMGGEPRFIKAVDFGIKKEPAPKEEGAQTVQERRKGVLKVVK